jgi:hypothetical protein
MNCLGFRRALTLLPASQDAEVLSHRRACADCDAFARRQSAFERTLAEAVKVEVPEGLASRALLVHRVSLEGAKRVRRRRVGLAAFTAGLGLAGGWLALRPQPLDRAVLAHIEKEPSHLADRRLLSPAQVNQALAPIGMTVSAEMGPVHYAGTCRIRRSLGAHLVLPGKKGPVTVLVMPGEPVDGCRPVRDGRFVGIILSAGGGSLAIVGEPGEALDWIESRLRRAVRFASRDRPKVSLSLGRGRRDV